MILIADSGSTKINWCLVQGDKVIRQAYTPGINAVMLTADQIAERIHRELPPEFRAEEIETVYYYGAGCINEQVCSNVRKAIQGSINCRKAKVYTDLLAAARALCGHNPGIACIMGTGSNSCLYDGENIIENVSPLGYILGDEGSGAVLGKVFMGDLLKNQLPQDIRQSFLSQYKLDRDTIIRHVYREPAPNRFLASFMPFLRNHIERKEIRDLVFNQFCAFIRRNIEQYTNYRNYPLNFIGSIAFYFYDLLKEAVEHCGCQMGVVIQSPMEGLIRFHEENPKEN